MPGTIATLVGGLGLFLLGMSMLTDGLKQAAGPALKDLLGRWTRTAARGLASGLLITALVQSSSAVTVATVGFVNAGLLSLNQAIWVVFGANVGTTMTGWLVALVGLKLDVVALALPMLGLGMAASLALKRRPRLSAAGQALAGFGLFFLGVGTLQQGFQGLETILPDPGGAPGPAALLGFVTLGFALTALTQSSSAAIAIALTAASSGGLSLLPAAAVVVGTNLGTTSTALFAALGATPAARRVAAAHILFNLLTAAVALALLAPLVALATAAAEGATGQALPATVLAIFHTLFNLLGVLLMVPLARPLGRWLEGRFAPRAGPSAQPRHLDPTLASLPDLAVEALRLEQGHLDELVSRLTRDALAAQGRAAVTGLGEAHALAAAMRDWVDRLSRTELRAATVEALADLLRARQHLETALTLLARLDPEARQHGPASAWSALLAAVEAVAHDTAPGPAGARAIEKAYQVLKRGLLADTARGQLSAEALDLALMEAQRLRRIGTALAKARRRAAMAGTDTEAPTGIA
ncbi:MAG: Na/Pi cotransporter family protein [Sphingomonadaceae bacterium]